jgi:hypothetical protein
VIVAVLAVIWVGALTPMMLRKLSERRLTTSVDSFHRQLSGLRRAYPRLAAVAAAPEMFVAFNEMAQDDAGALDTSRLMHSGVSERRTRHAGSAAARRRRVLTILAFTTVSLFLIGMIPPLKIFWGLSLLAFAALAGYMALLIYTHRREVERNTKVVNLRSRTHGSGEVSQPTAAIPVMAAYDSSGVAQNIPWEEQELLDLVYGFDFEQSAVGGR